MLGLLSSIPSFWGIAELEQIVTLYLDHCATTSSPSSALMPSLMKSVARRVPTKVLLPAMIELWPSVKASRELVCLISLPHFAYQSPYDLQDRLVAYLDLLTRGLRNATRPAVLEQLRPLFNVFLEAFDIAKVPSGKNTDVRLQLDPKKRMNKLNLCRRNSEPSQHSESSLSSSTTQLLDPFSAVCMIGHLWMTVVGHDFFSYSRRLLVHSGRREENLVLPSIHFPSGFLQGSRGRKSSPNRF